MITKDPKRTIVEVMTTKFRDRTTKFYQTTLKLSTYILNGLCEVGGKTSWQTMFVGYVAEKMCPPHYINQQSPNSSLQNRSRLQFNKNKFLL